MHERQLSPGATSNRDPLLGRFPPKIGQQGTNDKRGCCSSDVLGVAHQLPEVGLGHPLRNLHVDGITMQSLGFRPACLVLLQAPRQHGSSLASHYFNI